MEAFDWTYIAAFGLILIALEVLLFSFFLFWIGLGFLIVALCSYFGFFESAILQIAAALSAGLLLMFLLRSWSMRLVNKTADESEERTHTGGIATIKNGSIFLNGTYWQSDDDLSGFSDGDRVEIEEIVNNRAVVKK